MNKAEQLNFYQCIQLLSSLTEVGMICKGPYNPDNILVYRDKGEFLPEGFYSENLLSTASELAEDYSAQQHLISSLEEQTGEIACFDKILFKDREPLI